MICPAITQAEDITKARVPVGDDKSLTGGIEIARIHKLP